MEEDCQSFHAEGIRGYLHTPERPTGDGLAITHGAGSDANAPVVRMTARAFVEAGYTVLRFDLPFRQQRPKGPPFPAMAERDREGVRAAVAALRERAPGRIVLGGHSYGGRQSSMLAADDPSVADALLLLSYPLHPPAKPQQLRTAHFPALRTPALFVHGDRDPFGGLDEMASALAAIPARKELFAIEGAGHDLRPLLKRASEIVEKMRGVLGG
jgi:predicted alpha/beta-hydrolase family hydrolase